MAHVSEVGIDIFDEHRQCPNHADSKLYYEEGDEGAACEQSCSG